MCDESVGPGPEDWESAAQEMERYRRDGLVKILNKRIEGLEEVERDLRRQLGNCQTYNRYLIGVLQQHGIIRQTTDQQIVAGGTSFRWTCKGIAFDEVERAPTRRKPWWERWLDALARVPPEHW